MRRIVSLVWNDISRIQKIGNRKKISTRAIRTPRTMRSVVETCSTDAPSAVAARALAQLQPLLDEDVRQEIGYGPQDHQDGRRFPDVGVLEELKIGADLEAQQRVAG